MREREERRREQRREYKPKEVEWWWWWWWGVVNQAAYQVVRLETANGSMICTTVKRRNERERKRGTADTIPTSHYPPLRVLSIILDFNCLLHELRLLF